MATDVDTPYNNSELFLDRYLETGLTQRSEWDCINEAEAALDELHDLYEREYESVSSYTDNEEDTLDKWIEPVLETLGYEHLGETGLAGGSGSVDRVLFGSHEDRVESETPRSNDDFSTVYSNAATILEAKSWNADFSARFTEERNYFDASQQINYYLSHLPRDTVNWGILTDGCRWRLYGTNDHQTFIFYEINLPELIEQNDPEKFKYFYCLFRAAAFERSAGTGECFLDRVYRASENTARQLGDDLQDHVFEALAILGDGFIETNDLDVREDRTIAPESLAIDTTAGEEFTLDDLKEQSLIYLYRLMFVFYAESRDLLKPETDTNIRTYDEELSLIQHRDRIIEANDTFQHTTETYLDTISTLWRRLDEFFEVIDGGREDIGIQAYDGGLFDRDEHAFLNNHTVSNHHLAQVIFLLSTTIVDGEYTKVDYDDLETRHLGAIYEGLLEHQFRVASTEMVAVVDDDEEVWEEVDEADEDAEIVDRVAPGNLYVGTDDHERKVSGSYYTPKYIVNYIVENALGPRIDRIRDDLAENGLEPGTAEYARSFREHVLELDVLDPAMGSGHFLTRATSYLAREVVEVVQEVDELVVAEAEIATGGRDGSVLRDGGSTTSAAENHDDSGTETVIAAEDGASPPSGEGVDSDHPSSKFEETQIRRDIAKECIYGVDKNGVAVELAKLSMWLETLATDQPLAFLDHHLKHGDALVGSDIESIDGLNAGSNSDQQSTIMSFTERREDVIEMLIDVFEDLFAVPNETIEDARAMKRIYYEQIIDNPTYRRFKQIANVHTANEFGLDWTRESAFELSGIRSDAFQYMAEVLDNDERWDGDPPGEEVAVADASWFQSAQGRSSELSFFHWKLEFPEVFYDMDAEKRPEAGFDAVLGNPPWVGTRTGNIDDDVSEYLKRDDGFDAAAGQYDLAAVFAEQAAGLTAPEGSVGFVVPKRLATNEIFEGVREFLVEDHTLNHAVDLAVAFEGVNTDAMALIVDSDTDADELVVGEHEESQVNVRPIDHELLDAMPFTILPVNSTQPDIELVRTINQQATDSLDPDIIHRGGEFGMSEACISEQSGEHTWPILDHRDVGRHLVSMPEQHINLKEVDASDLKQLSIYDTVPKVLVRFLSSEIIAGRDEVGYVSTNLVYHVHTEGETDFLTGLLSTNLITFWYLHAFQSSEVKFPHVQQSHISALPLMLPDSDSPLEDVGIDETVGDRLSALDVDVSEDSPATTIRELVDTVIDLKERRAPMDVDLDHHLGDPPTGEDLADSGLYQPTVEDGSPLKTTKGDDYETTKIGSLHTEREGDTIQILATVRYRPDDPEVETGPHGFTETAPLPAFELLEVPELTKQVIEAFVPLVGEKGNSSHGLYTQPTQSKSLVDRIGEIELPEIDAVETTMERYQRVNQRAAELDDEIEEIESIIDTIVYESYDLTDEETSLIETSLSDL
jgi:type I restriction-modification system DNA methylase subunit